MKRITILAEVNAYSGYGHHLAAIFKGLEAAGFFVTVRPIRVSQPFPNAPNEPPIMQSISWRIQPEEWELQISPAFHHPTPGKKTIYWTMWESTKLTPEQITHLNAAALIIVPCHWCRDVFMANGVLPPIAVIPLGFDPEIFSPIKNMPQPGDKDWGNFPFIFGAAGRIRHGGSRKGVAEVVPVFQEAFPTEDDVRLNVKVHADDPLDELKTRDDRITLCRTHLSTGDVSHWLSQINCFVSGATAEGFGLWQIQAMAMGKPVIAPIYAGLREFMNQSVGYPVRYTEEAASGMWLGNWAEPDWTSMIGQMRLAYLEQEGNWFKGQRGAQWVQPFEWNNVVIMLIAAMDAVGAIHADVIPPVHETPPRDETNYEMPSDTRGPQDQFHDRGWECGRIVFPDQDQFKYFNPALVETDVHRFLFSRRAEWDEQGNAIKNRIVAWDMTGWTPSNPRELILDGRDNEDPRAYVASDGLIILTYTSIIDGKAQQMRSCLNHTLDNQFEVTGTTQRFRFGGNDGSYQEKNWIWFNRGGSHFIYTCCPHMVVAPATNWKDAIAVYTSGSRHPWWEYGQPRGGTPPLRIGDEFIRFFQSSLPWKKRRRRYWMGAYAFEAKPPFRVTRVIDQPIAHGIPTWASRRQEHSVIYPSGALYDGETWRVVMGNNDEECLWVEIPNDWLNKHLQAL